MRKVLIVVGVVAVLVVGAGLWLAFSIENRGVDPDATLSAAAPEAQVDEGDLVRFEVESATEEGDDWMWELPPGLDLSSYSAGAGADRTSWVEVDVEEAGTYEVVFSQCPGTAPCDAAEVVDEVTFRLVAA